MKRVIITPLNWGLGHAARISSIIDYLIEENYELVVASDGEALEFLRANFGSAIMAFEELPPYNVRYNKKNVTLALWHQWPHILKAIRAEYRTAQKLVKKYQPDWILSDNRFGVRTRACPSVILSHQINLVTNYTWLNPIASAFNKMLLNRFDQIWIPDFEGSLLSGKLSECKAENIHFVGPLHRHTDTLNHVKSPGILIVLSGPEPLRTQWESQLLSSSNSFNQKMTLIRGLPGKRTTIQHSNPLVQIYNFVNKPVLNQMIRQSDFVISRAGYSTIMDLCMLNKAAFLVPTPGQTEQEYLMKHLKNKVPVVFKDQRSFDLNFLQEYLKEMPPRAWPKFAKEQRKLIKQAIQSLFY